MSIDQKISNNIHSNISIDGLVIAKFSRSVFEEMQLGKITAANCTCSVWENFNETIDKLTVWNDHFRKNSDIICHVKSSTDIIKAHKDRNAASGSLRQKNPAVTKKIPLKLIITLRMEKLELFLDGKIQVL